MSSQASFIYSARKSFFARLSAFALPFLLVFSPIAPVLAEETDYSVTGKNIVENSEQSGVEVNQSNVENKNDIHQEIVTDSSELVTQEGTLFNEKEIQTESMSIGTPQSQPFDPRDLPNGSLPKTDEATGGLLYTYPLTVPPGRNDLDPELSLQYSSQSSDVSSVFGSGWSLAIPYIERINKTGADKLYTDDYFSSSLSGELMQVSGGTYAAKVDNGDFLKYSLSSNVWTVTDKSGTVYTFGSTTNARQDDPSNSAHVGRWMLQEVRDTNDNYIKYEYYKDNGQIYPETIIYTGHGSVDGIFTVSFTRQSRSDAITQNKYGFSVTTNYRISEITANSNGSWVRKYALLYTTGDNSQKSLLSSITESGRDTSLSVTTLPAVSFTYQTANSASPFTYDSSWTAAPSSTLDTRSRYGMIVADFNGDGLPDLLESYDNGVHPVFKNAYRNNGDGTWTLDTNYTPPVTFATVGGPYDYGVRAADVNGDGLTDLVQSIDGVGISIHQTYRNTGSSWVLDTAWVPPYEFSNPTFGDTGGRIADINGDGLPDFFKAIDTGSGVVTNVQLNTGSGWSADTGWAMPLDVRYGVIPIDYNGDGLVDFLQGYRNNLGVDIKSAYKNNGDKTWSLDSTYTPPIIFAVHSSGSVFPDDVGVRVIDINGDGLPDIVKSSDISSTNQRETHLNKGPGWVSSPYLLAPYFLNFWGDDSGFRPGDFNGDGMVDFYQSGSSIGTNLYKHVKPKADLLSTITNQYGGITTITYKGSPQYINGSTRLNPDLPYIFDTVYQISSNYGFGGSIETNIYSYEGGEYYFNTHLDRKPAGFSKIIKTDGVGNKVTNLYHQGNSTNSSQGEYSDHGSKIGKPYRTEIANSAGNVYQTIINKWDHHNIGTNRDFVKLVRTTTLDYDGNFGHKDSVVEYDYNNTYGNVIEKISWGEVIANNDGSFTDTGSDQMTETISYVAATTPYIVGLPYQHVVEDQSSNKVRETKTYYDNLSLGSVSDGNPTKVEKWKESTSYVNTQKSYNSYGLVSTATDERGKVTSYVYDTYNLYPITVTNPLSQATSYTYDYSSGKQESMTDPNGFVQEFVYDGLDRVLQEKVSDPSTFGVLVTKASYIYVDTSGAVSTQETKHYSPTVSRDTYRYFDGLNRLIQERSESESGYNVRDIGYTAHGYKARETLPYASTGNARTTPTSTNSLYTRYDYDPLGRITAINNVVGNATNTYDDWSTYVTDLNGNQKKYSYDAYKRLINVDEFDGAFTVYSTFYDWNLNNKLTKITDASGNIRNFTYDGLERRTSAQDLHAPADLTYGTWNYTYDNAGNLTQSVSPNAATVNYTYDDINRILTENYTGAPGTEIGHVYDTCTNGIGKLCDVIMLSGANSSYAYDYAGNRNNEDRIINGTTYVTSYEYDYQGGVSSVTYPDSAEVRFIPNPAGLLEKIEWKENGGSFADIISDINYSPLSQKTYIVYGNGAATTNTYDAAELYRLRNTTSTDLTPTNVQDITYTYDGNGNITQIIDASGTKAAKTAVYVYDDLNRLTSATITGVPLGQTPYTHTLTYSGIGNITNKSNVGNYLYQGSSGANWANPHAATSINGVAVTYDKNGNMLTYGPGMANTWNYKNELARTVVPGKTIDYLYDHEGNRVSYDDGTTVTDYANKLYNTDGADVTKDIYAGDVLVATIETVGGTATPHYVHTDNILGSNVITDASGILEQTLDYYPFGEVRINDKVTSFDEGKQYGGHYFDDDTDLNYMRARYYKGQTGRFLSQDNLFLAIGANTEQYGKNINVLLANPQELNAYSYALNNPLKYVDMDGNSAVALVATNPVAIILSALFVPRELSYDPVYESAEYAFQNSSEYKQQSFIMGAISPMPGGATAGKILSNAEKMAAIRASGKIGEAKMGEIITEGVEQSYHNTTLGKRFIDRETPTSINESKNGFVSLTQTIKTQALKDLEISNLTGKEANWYLFKGGSAPAKEFLINLGINVKDLSKLQK